MFFQEEIIFLVVTGLLFLVTPHDKARAYNSSYSLMLPLMILVIIGALKGIHTINKDFYRDVILFSKTIVYIIAGIALSKFVKDLNDFFKYFLFIALVSALVHIWLLVINIHSISSLETIRFYAGFPLKLDNGSCIGTLCLLDTRPRTLEGPDLERLHDLAGIALREILGLTTR